MPADPDEEHNRFGVDTGEDCECQFDAKKFIDEPCQFHRGQCVETVVEKRRLSRENERLVQIIAGLDYAVLLASYYQKVDHEKDAADVLRNAIAAKEKRDENLSGVRS